MSVLDEEFYHNAKGEYLDRNAVVGDCITRNIYFVLKHRLITSGQGDVRELYKCFLQGLYLRVEIDEEKKQIRLVEEDNMFFENLVDSIDRIECINDIEQAKNTIKKIHDNKDIAFIEAKAKHIPFYKSSHLDDNEEREIKFLLLGEEGDSWYYVYTYNLYNMDYFKPCEKNQSVGIIPKQDLDKALSDRVIINIVSPKLEAIATANECVRSSLEQSVSKYYQKNSGNTLYGYEGQKWLCDYVKNNKLYFSTSDSKSKDALCIDCENIRIVSVWANNRKKQFMYLIEMLEISNDAVMKEFVAKLEGSIDAWASLNRLLLHEFYTKSSYFSEKVIPIMEKIVSADVAMMDFIQQNLDTIVQKLGEGETL